MPIIDIDQKTCNRCGLCANECPLRLIVLQDGGFPQPTAQADAACIACGHCVAVCPSGSLNHQQVPLGKSIGMEDSLNVTPAQVEQLLKVRRSVRVYKDKLVSREIITGLVDVARYSPTGHNLQQLEWLVVDNKKELEHIEDLGLEWVQWVVKNLPQVAANLHMDELLERQKLYHNVFLRGAPVLVVVHAATDDRKPTITGIDSSIALGYLDLAATSMGLGTTWAGFIYTMANTFPPLQAALALPKGHTAYGCMMLGYNKFKYHRIPFRKEPKIVWR